MSRRDDYVSDMPGMPITDTDVEALLSRREPYDRELRGLSSALARLELQRLDIRVEERVGVFSLRAAALARQSGMPSTVTVPLWRRVGPRLVTSALSMMLVIGISGVAVASDAAAPGDLLYGIDRALETIGINDGGVTERLEEAATMADHGQTVEALEHAAEAVLGTSPEAADALQHAAEAGAQGQDVNAAVAEMLQWMATADNIGSDFGQGVAERARALGADNTNDSGNVQGPPTTGPGNSGNAPSQSGETPDSSGNARGNSGNAPSNGGNEGAGGSGNGPPGGTPPGRAND